VTYAQAHLRSAADLQRIRGHRKPTPADGKLLYFALAAADKLNETQLPPRRALADAPAGPRTRVDRELVKERLNAMKAAITQLAEAMGMAHDVLLTPRLVKELAALPQVGDESDVADFLRERGARPWQVEHTAAVLADAAARIG